MVMEYFCYHRDRLGSLALRRELLEEHWFYMGRYADVEVHDWEFGGCR
ncbi:hypothetical protein ACGF8B_37050 [Streptomyces sp. NPDC047917]